MAEPVELWDVPAVAAYLGVARSTVTSYLSRNQMPQPEFRFSGRPVWRADTIRRWHEGRPSRRPESDAR